MASVCVRDFVCWARACVLCALKRKGWTHDIDLCPDNLKRIGNYIYIRTHNLNIDIGKVIFLSN